MGKCDSKSYLLFILSRINCLDETKSSIEDHSGGWTQYEKSFVVRRTLCLRQYYLDQVFGYNLSSENMLQFHYPRLICSDYKQLVSENSAYLLAPLELLLAKVILILEKASIWSKKRRLSTIKC